MSKRLEMFDKLIGGGSKDPFHHYARALELRSLDRKTDALSALLQVTQDYPDYVPSYLIAAQLAMESNDVARARELCEAGILAARRTHNDHALGELTELRGTLPD
jgi:predicted Zn-dependent protease